MKYDIESIEKRRNKEKKIKKIFEVFMIIAIYHIILLGISYVNELQIPSIFGYNAYNITTNSMEPKIHKGDVVIIKNQKEENLKIGDIITFEKNKEIITHRITNIEEKEGIKQYTTKGDNNTTEDIKSIQFKEIKGKLVISIPYLGRVITFVKDKTIILIIVLIILILYLYYIEKNEKQENRRKKKKIEEERNS